ncbi:MAG TPA: dihydrodipicolinate synthase family protein [Firmicutes bacterium]|nr:dihydrodipicolinate synthase family protein [Bacillota bacterium]
MAEVSKLEGIFAPIAIPFENQELSIPRLKENLDRWNRSRLRGLVVLGSNGEFPLLDRAEKRSVLECVRENASPDKVLIAGTGDESTRETIRLCKEAAEIGYDACLVVNPSYYKGSMTDAALKAFYDEVADHSPIPVLAYNVPRNTGINMSSQLMIRISEHPNVIGVKDSSGNIVQISEILAEAKPGFRVFAGSGSFLLPSLCMGAVGATAAVANVFPDECDEIVNAFKKGDLHTARQLQLAILDVNAAVTTRWGVAGLKAAMDIEGYFGGLPRRPILPLTEAQVVELKGVVKQFKLRVQQIRGA